MSSVSAHFNSMVTYYAEVPVATKDLQISTILPINEGNAGVLFVSKFDETKLIKKSVNNSLINEFVIGKMIDHPNFMKVHRLFKKIYLDENEKEVDCVYKLEIERIEGKSLEGVLISEKVNRNFYLKLTEAIYNSILYLNEQQIVWEDLTPKNIMISNEGEVKFVDYGLYLQEPDDASRIKSLLENYQTLTCMMEENHEMAEDVEEINLHILELLDDTIAELEKGALAQHTLRFFLDHIRLYFRCL